MLVKRFIYILISGIILTGCKTNRHQVDVSKINVEINIKRFDEDVYHADIDNIDSTIQLLSDKYGNFFDLFNHRIIKIGGTNNSGYSDYFINFLTDYTVNEIMNAVNEKFEDVTHIEQKLALAFKHYNYYYPDNEIPEIITFVAGFNQSIVIDEKLLAIGLDKYLGPGSNIYGYIGVPNYKRKNMDPLKIPSDCMRSIAATNYEYNDSVDNLLNRMIYEGKIMFFIDAMLPGEPDHMKIGYSEEQLEWCDKNESRMWTFFVEEKLLYTSDYMQIKRYIDDSPFTVTFSQESPGRTGVWLGWQIIRNYMKNNDVTLHELMLDDNYQSILNKSKYKP